MVKITQIICPKQNLKRVNQNTKKQTTLYQIYQKKMSEDNESQRTPEQEHEKEEIPGSTHVKWVDDSEIKNNRTYEEKLKEIQDNIQSVKKQLQENSQRRHKFPPKEKISLEYLQLQNKRRTLKIELVSLNYAHIREHTLHQIEQKVKEQREEQERKQNRQREEEELREKLLKEKQQRQAEIQKINEDKKRLNESKEQNIKKQIEIRQKQFELQLNLSRERRKLQIQNIISQKYSYPWIYSSYWKYDYDYDYRFYRDSYLTIYDYPLYRPSYYPYPYRYL